MQINNNKKNLKNNIIKLNSPVRPAIIALTATDFTNIVRVKPSRTFLWAEMRSGPLPSAKPDGKNKKNQERKRETRVCVCLAPLCVCFLNV